LVPLTLLGIPEYLSGTHRFCFYSNIPTQSARQSDKLFLQSSELGLPQPLTRKRVCPPPLPGTPTPLPGFLLGQGSCSPVLHGYIRVAQSGERGGSVRHWIPRPYVRTVRGEPAPLLWLEGEGHTRWRERGWESPNSTTREHALWYSLYMSTLCIPICTLCSVLHGSQYRTQPYFAHVGGQTLSIFRSFRSHDLLPPPSPTSRIFRLQPENFHSRPSRTLHQGALCKLPEYNQICS
jgi:hypothetical protein